MAKAQVNEVSHNADQKDALFKVRATTPDCRVTAVHFAPALRVAPLV